MYSSVRQTQSRIPRIEVSPHTWDSYNPENYSFYPVNTREKDPRITVSSKSEITLPENGFKAYLVDFEFGSLSLFCRISCVICNLVKVKSIGFIWSQVFKKIWIGVYTEFRPEFLYPVLIIHTLERNLDI